MIDDQLRQDEFSEKKKKKGGKKTNTTTPKTLNSDVSSQSLRLPGILAQHSPCQERSGGVMPLTCK